MRSLPHAMPGNVRGTPTALVAALAAALSACAGAPVDESEPLSRSCAPSNCFFERNVRDFEVIDQTTLLVYVGAQRCPFIVEVDGMFCDLTFSSMLRFRSGDSRICAYDRVQLESDPFGRPEERCRLRDVRSITDNEVVELLVDRGAAPPAPVGSGELRVEDEPRVEDDEDAEDELRVEDDEGEEAGDAIEASGRTGDEEEEQGAPPAAN